jgi:hypothetical protein
MKKRIKLKNMTTEQWDNWLDNNCNLKVECENCPAYRANCDSSKNENCWINNKDIYSDKFLNQEVEIEIENEELLDEEDRRYLTNMYNLINVRNYEIYTICKCVDSFLGKKIGFISITFKSNVEDYGCERLCGPLFNPEERFKNLEIDKGYRLEELGL